MANANASAHHPTHQAYQILHTGFIVLPILAGLDKFFHVLTDWNQYLAPFIPQMLGLDAGTILMIVGVVEIAAGLVVWFRPRFGGYLVMAWLWAIIINLLLIPGYFDIALRDFGLSLGALCLARLAEVEVATHSVRGMREAHALR
jgi:hypothetical protein